MSNAVYRTRRVATLAILGLSAVVAIAVSTASASGKKRHTSSTQRHRHVTTKHHRRATKKHHRRATTKHHRRATKKHHRRVTKKHRPVTATTTPTPATTPQPLGDPGQWNLVLDSRFNGSSLPSPWSSSRYDDGQTAAGFGSSDEECLDPTHVTVAGGHADLALTANSESCNGHTQPYTSGMITTYNKWTYTYGYLEARVWIPGSNGVIADWPSAWAVGNNWPAGGELDVMEGLGGSACWHFHDPSGGPGGCANGNYTGGWHVFGADWEPGHVTYYYDGVKVGTVTSGITSSPMCLILALAVSNGAPIEAPASELISYVRVWQH